VPDCSIFTWWLYLHPLRVHIQWLTCTAILVFPVVISSHLYTNSELNVLVLFFGRQNSLQNRGVLPTARSMWDGEGLQSGNHLHATFEGSAALFCWLWHFLSVILACPGLHSASPTHFPTFFPNMCEVQQSLSLNTSHKPSFFKINSSLTYTSKASPSSHSPGGKAEFYFSPSNAGE
jgi:hypothetical protein